MGCPQLANADWSNSKKYVMDKLFRSQRFETEQPTFKNEGCEWQFPIIVRREIKSENRVNQLNKIVADTHLQHAQWKH